MTFGIFALGMGVSFAMPFMSLYGVKQVGMSPAWLGAFMTAMSVSSIILSTLLGRWSDQMSSRRPAVLVALLSAVIGYALLSRTHTFAPALLIAITLLALGSAGFPQMFSYARAQMSRAPAAQVQPALAEHAVTVLRSVFSLAWVAGPALGAVVLDRFQFGGLFLSVAGLYLAASLVVLLRPASQPVDTVQAADATLEPSQPATVPPEAPPLEAASSTPSAPQASIPLVAAAFTLYAASISAQMIALPLFVTQELHGTTANVGFLLGLCALLEIPIMLSFVLRPSRKSAESLLLLGFALCVLMTLMMGLAPGLWLAVLAQGVRAVVIAIVSCIGMSYFQELMPGRMGAATTLFANTSSAGSVLAGALVGGVAQLSTYRAVFWVCLLLCVVAYGLLWRGTRKA